LACPRPRRVRQPPRSGPALDRNRRLGLPNGQRTRGTGPREVARPRPAFRTRRLRWSARRRGVRRSEPRTAFFPLNRPRPDSRSTDPPPRTDGLQADVRIDAHMRLRVINCHDVKPFDRPRKRSDGYGAHDIDTPWACDRSHITRSGIRPVLTHPANPKFYMCNCTHLRLPQHHPTRARRQDASRRAVDATSPPEPSHCPQRALRTHGAPRGGTGAGRAGRAGDGTRAARGRTQQARTGHRRQNRHLSSDRRAHRAHKKRSRRTRRSPTRSTTHPSLLGVWGLLGQAPVVWSYEPGRPSWGNWPSRACCAG
jgi:hypothetical protein